MYNHRLGVLDASDLDLKDAYITSNGEGNAYIKAKNYFKAEILNKGNIYYQGNATTDFTDQGEGNFIKQ